MQNPFPLIHLSSIEFDFTSIEDLPSSSLYLAQFSPNYKPAFYRPIIRELRRRREACRATVGNQEGMGVFATKEIRRKEFWPRIEFMTYEFDISAGVESLTSAQLLVLVWKFHKDSTVELSESAEDEFATRREQDLAAGLSLKLIDDSFQAVQQLVSNPSNSIPPPSPTLQKSFKSELPRILTETDPVEDWLNNIPLETPDLNVDEIITTMQLQHSHFSTIVKKEGMSEEKASSTRASTSHSVSKTIVKTEEAESIKLVEEKRLKKILKKKRSRSNKETTNHRETDKEAEGERERKRGKVMKEDKKSSLKRNRSSRSSSPHTRSISSPTHLQRNASSSKTFSSKHQSLPPTEFIPPTGALSFRASDTIVTLLVLIVHKTISHQEFGNFLISIGSQDVGYKITQSKNCGKFISPHLNYLIAFENEAAAETVRNLLNTKFLVGTKLAANYERKRYDLWNYEDLKSEFVIRLEYRLT